MEHIALTALVLVVLCGFYVVLRNGGSFHIRTALRLVGLMMEATLKTTASPARRRRPTRLDRKRQSKKNR